MTEKRLALYDQVGLWLIVVMSLVPLVPYAIIGSGG
jgi:hypothetical protein